jgi:hypothetical protein
MEKGGKGSDRGLFEATVIDVTEENSELPRLRLEPVPPKHKSDGVLTSRHAELTRRHFRLPTARRVFLFRDIFSCVQEDTRDTSVHNSYGAQSDQLHKQR